MSGVGDVSACLVSVSNVGGVGSRVSLNFFRRGCLGYLVWVVCIVPLPDVMTFGHGWCVLLVLRWCIVLRPRLVVWLCWLCWAAAFTIGRFDSRRHQYFFLVCGGMGCGVCLCCALLASIVDLALGVSLRCGVWVLLLLGCCVHCLR